MTDEQTSLAHGLMQAAVCHTDHPASAAAALMVAAGELLHAKFGIAGACQLMRSIIDDTEAAMIQAHGQQAGEPVQ